MALQTVTLGDAITLSVPMRTGGAAFTPAAGYQLIFTAKLATSDADVAALIQKKSGGFGITESGSSALIELLPIDTSALSGDITLYCDIQAQSLTDASVIKTVALFQLLTVRDVTRDTDTSIPVYTSEPPGIAYIKAEAQSGSFTAVANFQYTLLATGTVTDPATAEEGDAFTVFVSAGTGTIGGTAYPAEAIIIRSYESAAWKNTAVGNGDALVADPLSQFAATTSAQLAGVLTDETGTGSAVFATSPTLTSPVLNTGVSGSAILDEDDLASDSDKLATQRSIKAYVDDAIKAVTITAKVNEAGGITKGQVVFISGATGGFPQVSLADNTDFSKADVLAVSTETKTDGQNVAITIAGLVENIDTSAYTEGAVLYLGTSGNITEIHPTGIHAVERIGHAVKINASTGSILVELDGLTIINDHDGIMRHQIVNQNAGTSASAAYTIVNDALRRSSISMVGSNYNVVAGISNSLIIYNEGYNKTVNAVDGNYGFEWWTDETDSHNLTSTSKMSLTADGELNTLVQTIDHTATEADDHALEIDCDAAGYGDVKAIDVAYDTGAITPWQDEAVMLVNINQSAAIGGDVTALEVLATEGSANINGMLAGAGVNPIEQLSGVFYDMDSALVNATDRLTEFTTAGNDVQMFVADNDTVTIASFAKFEQLQFILAITASLSIRPSFEFSTGPGTWTAFTPVDGTNGMRNTGVIAWLSGDIPTWAVGTGGKYLIRITRKRNSLATPPTESKVQIAATTAYKWDKDGDLIVNTVTATGNVESANTGANAPVSTAQAAADAVVLAASVQKKGKLAPITFTTGPVNTLDGAWHAPGNGATVTNNGTVCRMPNTSPGFPIKKIACGFPNYTVSNTGTLRDNATIIVRASIEYPSGTFRQLLFDGKKDTRIDSGGYVETDSLDIDIPADTVFWVRTFAVASEAGGLDLTSKNFISTTTGTLILGTVGVAATAAVTVTSGRIRTITPTTSGSGYPPNTRITCTIGNPGGGSGAVVIANIGAAGTVTGYTIEDGGAGYTGTPTIATAGNLTGTVNNDSIPIDKTMSSGGQSVTFSGYGPSQILGVGDGTPPNTYAALGDSITAGAYDYNNGWRGWPYRIFNTYGTPIVNLGVSGISAFDGYADESNAWMNLLPTEHCSHFILALGPNDLNNSRTSTQIIADLTRIIQRLQGLGKVVDLCTITPHTDGSDVPRASEPYRVAVNAWIRTAPEGVRNVYDIADAMETSRDSGVWTTGYFYASESGGTVRLHPNGAGYDAMVAAFSAID